MLNKLRYVNHENKTIVFGENGILVNENDIRSYSWGYNVKYNKLRSFYRNSATKSIMVKCYGENATALANDIYATIERDVIEQKEGKLYCGDYYLKGYFVAMSSPKRIGDFISFNLGYLASMPVWLKDGAVVPFGVGQGGVTPSDFLDYPHGYAYDYAARMNNTTLENTNFTPTDFVMKIDGAVNNPKVYINGHMYAVNYDIEIGQHITINSIDKTIKLNDNGQITNLFEYRDRDSYIFEKIPSGSNMVAWGSDFNFTLQLIEQRSEPKWI